MGLDEILSKREMAENAQIIAYKDLDFIESEPCRTVRLQLEYLKPALALELFKVESTFVIFGSARTKSPEQAREDLNKALKFLADNPGSPEALAKVNEAEDMLKGSHYYQVARELAATVTRESQRQDGTDRTFVVITGGGGGIMEAGNRGAADAGGISVALNINLPFEQHPNPYITPELSFQLNYFSIRKMHFLKRARALSCFPGGFGTMDELFEALTLIQTKKIPRMPLLIYGKEFWDELINWELFIERGLICREDLDLMTYCETAADGWNAIKKFYGRE